MYNDSIGCCLMMNSAETCHCWLQVMRAPLSGRSRNFGFCRFANEQERDRALVEMNAHEICGRPVRVSLATARKTQTSVSLDVPTPGRNS